jgi:hypothetical protein
VPLAQLQVDIDGVGDCLRLGQGFGVAGECILERRVHLLRRAEMELVRIHPHAVGIRAELAGVHAQQNVLGLGILLVDVVGVARGHERNAHPPGHFDGPLHRHPLDADAVVLHLDEIAVAEDPVEPPGDLHRRRDVRLHLWSGVWSGHSVTGVRVTE